MNNQVSRYEIERELGRGGMATVYMAYDPRFKRKVALKVLPQNLAYDDNFRHRFEREAQTIANLEHESIVPVYDFGEEKGQLFLVMRLMTGGTLADKLRVGRLPAGDIELLVQRIASALDRAHREGLVHRDLKPGNILYDDGGRPYLSDFGIVKVTEGQNLTNTGGIIGTPAYMSPEQAIAEVALDGRSDVYALGIILYEVLSGQPPYRADTPMGLVVAHVKNPIPRLPTTQIGLPAGVADVVAQAMAKERTQRYNTAGDLAAAFSAAMGGRPIPPVSNWQQTVVELPTLPPAQQPTLPPTYLTPAGASRNPFMWILAGGVVFVLGLFLVFGLLMAGGFLTRLGNQPTEVVAVAEKTVAATDDLVAQIDLEATEQPSPTLEATITTPLSEAPSATPTETPWPTETPSPTPTRPPITEFIRIGQSSKGASLTMARVGYGPIRIVIVGGIHGDEPYTVSLVQGLSDYFYDNVNLVPAGATFYFLPSLSPDGLAEDDRFTPGGVDLNRNWDTPSWLKDSFQPGGVKAGSGGDFPFSEPETEALSHFLLDLQADSGTENLYVIFYHHHTGVADVGQVQPGYIIYGSPTSESSGIAVTMANAGGYQYIPFWNGPYQPTGEAINWCATQNISAVDVELPPEGNPDERPAGQSRTILQSAIESILALSEG